MLKCFKTKTLLSLSLYQQQRRSFLSRINSAACCLASVSLDAGHCTSSFISRFFSNLSSHRSETHFFRLSICPTSSIWLSISLFVSPLVCRSFPFRSVIPATYFWGHSRVINFSLIRLFQLLYAMWCFRVQTHLVPQPFHPHILFCFSVLPSRLLTLHWYSSLSAKMKIHTAAGMYWSQFHYASPFLWVPSLFLTPYMVTKPFSCMLLLPLRSSSLRPPLNLTSRWLVLFPWQPFAKKTETKLPFPFPTAWLQHYISSQLFPWKIQRVSLWRVAQDLGTFWGWFCLRCNGVCECQFYTEPQTTSMHRAGT